MPTTSTSPSDAAGSPERPGLIELLADAGLRHLPPAALRELAEVIAPALSERVGGRLIAALSPAQVAQFEALTAGEDESAASGWLEQALPDFREVVAQEMHDIAQETASRVRAALTVSPAPGVGATPAKNTSAKGESR